MASLTFGTANPGTLALGTVNPGKLSGPVTARPGPLGGVTVANPGTLTLAGSAGNSIPKASSTTIAAPSGSSSSSGSGYTNPALASYYGNAAEQIKSILAALPTQQEEGVKNIGNSSNASLNALNTGESQTMSDIAGKENTANFNKVQSLNNVDNNVADTVGSYRRLVGAGHAGVSAFARDFIPMATAREGTTQRQGVFNGFGQDMAGLETSKKNAQTEYDQNRSDITAKRNSDIIDFINGILGQKDQLNQQAAQDAAYAQYYQGGDSTGVNGAVAPFDTSGADRIAALKSLFAKYANPTYTVNPVRVTTPDLSNYTQDPLQARLSTTGGGAQLADLPFMAQIGRKQDTRTIS